MNNFKAAFQILRIESSESNIYLTVAVMFALYIVISLKIEPLGLMLLASKCLTRFQTLRWEPAWASGILQYLWELNMALESKIQVQVLQTGANDADLMSAILHFIGAKQYDPDLVVEYLKKNQLASAAIIKAAEELSKSPNRQT